MGDIMLKKAREYLQDRLDDVNRELKERKLLQKDYPELRRKYQEGRYFADLVMDLDKARRTVVERLLFCITVISLGGSLCRSHYKNWLFGIFFVRLGS